MALNIETFNNVTGGHSFFKAIGHPLAAEKVGILIQELKNHKQVAFYDPLGFLAPFAELYNIQDIKMCGVYIQRYEDLNKEIMGFQPKFISEILKDTPALLIVAFDGEPLLNHIKHLIGQTTKVYTLDFIKLPQALLTNPLKYLDPLNFATNFAFFRQEQQLSTRLVTTNYWSVYSKKTTNLWLRLIDHKGQELATWSQELGPPQSTIVIDSREIQKRFKLPDFNGQLFLHVVGAAGHDIVKYALDIQNEDGSILSCTHDANAWPADLYAGLPAPREDEEVILWVQNSHPCPIPSHKIGLNQMGSSEIQWYAQEIPPFGSVPLDVKTLLPKLHWPQQIEIQAGKYFVRPRYEIIKKTTRWIAHANVERTDLKIDPELPKLEKYFGEGFILPAPILPLSHWHTHILPTPMSTAQETLPLKLKIHDSKGKIIYEESLGSLKRTDSKAVNVSALLEEKNLTLLEGFGHVSLVYNFACGNSADGWLHGLFRYERKELDYAAETSFGAHIFNTVITYKNQPQSYRGRPPGLTTRLFLRLGSHNYDTHCHLIYPVSSAWHTLSSTELQLYNKEGIQVAVHTINIPCNGSLYWRYSDIFTPLERGKAGEDAYVIIRDQTCRLFGYHGLYYTKGPFSLDHMFGF